MKLTKQYVADIYKKIKEQRPIIHCITNAVTVNDCANILLALGASPTMAHHPLEVGEITQGAKSLVCNFGAIGDYEAMLAAAMRAHELGHPIVIDPVGVSGSSYRREHALNLIDKVRPGCIRGNYSEIRALLENCGTVTGVDAAEADQDADHQAALIEVMKEYADEKQTILIASGKTDIITDGNVTYLCENGDPLMAKITGSGCMSSVMLGAFLGVEESVECAAACCSFMGIAGELAAERARACGGGTMTFRDYMIDAVSMMKEEDFGRVSCWKTDCVFLQRIGEKRD
ncbi:MAG: hydroxyethylthiazole kinase [Agathobacter sp.]|nr:hydroxyethylthiazole kinase [Agathobacter sp.]